VRWVRVTIAATLHFVRMAHATAASMSTLCELGVGATGGWSASARRWARADELPVAPQSESNAQNQNRHGTTDYLVERATLVSKSF
jgi:hypothetical protein